MSLPAPARMACALLPLALLAGCEGAPDYARSPPATPRFDALAFFTGQSRGAATLHILFKAPEPVRVESHGRMTGGTLLLDQTIRRGTRPATHRQWRLHEIAPGRYSGTLTDAAGPVTGVARGALLTLSYTTRDGMAAEQWLLLAPDGRSARNRLVFRKFGLTVATIDEKITRMGDEERR